MIIIDQVLCFLTVFTGDLVRDRKKTYFAVSVDIYRYFLGHSHYIK